MSTRKQDAAERAARLGEIRQKQLRAERRRTALIIGVSALVAVVLIAVTTTVIVGEQRDHQGGVTMAQAALDLVEDEDVRRLAQAIVDSQTAELTVLEQMLDQRASFL